MTRDCGHSAGMTETADTVQEMTRDCGHSTGDDQRLRTAQYRDDQGETADTVQYDQRLRTQYRDDQRLRTQYRDDQRLRTQYRDDQRLRTQYRDADSTGMTRDCGQHRDDQRGGRGTEFDRYPLPLPR
ncbi:unnamed protein product, partial [Staurois parvus]